MRRSRCRPQRPAPAPAEPLDPAQRERALLLRAFETTTLTKANFCALKGIAVAELDAALALARDERVQRQAKLQAQGAPAQPDARRARGPSR
ncbi:MAG: hypothetical protein KIS83_03335 [Rubrivivax sp.]|nr:hypothetical protein [Rubrivivax sp.]